MDGESGERVKISQTMAVLIVVEPGVLKNAIDITCQLVRM